ncbi:ABC transporter ATP-binding protein [Nocardiopsis sp. CNT-189]|uniref:ABC transporter ATP-binding protein n=1 Tax=Nocardiopsis oceanisediminis TaxID=2816862 RepID=UPI003B372746
MSEGDEKASGGTAGALRGLLPYIRPHRRAMILVLVLTLGSSAAGLMQPLLASRVISALEGGGGLATPILLLVALVVLAGAFNAATIWFGERMSQNMIIRVRKGLIGRMIRFRISEFDRSSPGDLTTRVTSDSQLLQQASSSGIVQILDGAITLITALAIMLFLDPTLFAVTTGVMLTIGAIALFFMPQIRRASDATQQEIGALGASLEKSLGAARTVKSNRAEEREIREAEKAAERAYAAGMRGARYQAVIGVLSGLAVQVSFLVVLGAGGALVAAGTVQLGVLIAFLLYLFRLIAPVFSLVSGSGMLSQGLGALRRIEEVAHKAVEEDVDGEVGRDPGGPPRVTVQDVTFAYPEREPVLSSLAFEAAPAARTALVGPSGAGKTTFFELLQRFYDPDHGRILFDGVDVRTRSRAELRERIAYVEQDAAMLDGTVRENLCYGAPGATDEEIFRVLSRTRLQDFVRGLPQGLDSRVGSRGAALSGGERQRLAIARALLRRPDVLLLDEATSQLDARSEAALQETVELAAEKCTVLLIAHRLSTVTAVERIVVLEEGRVRAVGDHASLMEEDELYRELATTQLITADRLPRPRVAG